LYLAGLASRLSALEDRLQLLPVVDLGRHLGSSPWYPPPPRPNSSRSSANASIDSQSVKSAEGGQEIDTDGGKKVHGRKRHILVDTLGFLLAVVVTAANVNDGRAAPQVLGQLSDKQVPRLEVIYGDSQYHNTTLSDWLEDNHKLYRIEVVRRPKGERKFQPLKVRWVVERTLAWLGRWRRLSKDYEHLPESSESMVKIAAIHHMLGRLCPKKRKRSERFRFKKRRRKRVV
jgi:putative transposase